MKTLKTFNNEWICCPMGFSREINAVLYVKNGTKWPQNSQKSKIIIDQNEFDVQ